MARHRSKTHRPLPPLLVRLIEAAEDADRKHDANALRACGALALWALPTRGVFVANDEEVTPSGLAFGITLACLPGMGAEQ